MSKPRRSSSPFNGLYKLIQSIVAIFAAAIVGWLFVNNPQPKTPGVTEPAQWHTVVYVYDGDTFKLENGEKVRLIGIDTPESKDNEKLHRDVVKLKMNRKVLLAMGKKASEYSHEMLLDQKVRLEFDVGQRDRYQRLLAYVYLSDGTFVNEKIIAQGYAYPLTIPPNVKYADLFKKRCDEARDSKRALWKDNS